jgi:hypothetical protein
VPFDVGDLCPPGLPVDLQQRLQVGGGQARSGQVEVGGLGMSPMGVSTAPTLPSIRSHIHLRTRLFSP